MNHAVHGSKLQVLDLFQYRPELPPAYHQNFPPLTIYSDHTYRHIAKRAGDRARDVEAWTLSAQSLSRTHPPAIQATDMATLDDVCNELDRLAMGEFEGNSLYGNFGLETPDTTSLWSMVSWEGVEQNNRDLMMQSVPQLLPSTSLAQNAFQIHPNSLASSFSTAAQPLPQSPPGALTSRTPFPSTNFTFSMPSVHKVTPCFSSTAAQETVNSEIYCPPIWTADSGQSFEEWSTDFVDNLPTAPYTDDGTQGDMPMDSFAALTESLLASTTPFSTSTDPSTDDGTQGGVPMDSSTALSESLLASTPPFSSSTDPSTDDGTQGGVPMDLSTDLSESLLASTTPFSSSDPSTDDGTQGGVPMDSSTALSDSLLAKPTPGPAVDDLVCLSASLSIGDPEPPRAATASNVNVAAHEPFSLLSGALTPKFNRTVTPRETPAQVMQVVSPPSSEGVMYTALPASTTGSSMLTAAPSSVPADMSPGFKATVELTAQGHLSMAVDAPSSSLTSSNSLPPDDSSYISATTHAAPMYSSLSGALGPVVKPPSATSPNILIEMATVQVPAIAVSSSSGMGARLPSEDKKALTDSSAPPAFSSASSASTPIEVLAEEAEVIAHSKGKQNAMETKKEEVAHSSSLNSTSVIESGACTAPAGSTSTPKATHSSSSTRATASNLSGVSKLVTTTEQEAAKPKGIVRTSRSSSRPSSAAATPAMFSTLPVSSSGASRLPVTQSLSATTPTAKKATPSRSPATLANLSPLNKKPGKAKETQKVEQVVAVPAQVMKLRAQPKVPIPSAVKASFLSTSSSSTAVTAPAKYSTPTSSSLGTPKIPATQPLSSTTANKPKAKDIAKPAVAPPKSTTASRPPVKLASATASTTNASSVSKANETETKKGEKFEGESAQVESKGKGKDGEEVQAKAHGKEMEKEMVMVPETTVPPKLDSNPPNAVNLTPESQSLRPNSNASIPAICNGTPNETPREIESKPMVPTSAVISPASLNPNAMMHTVDEIAREDGEIDDVANLSPPLLPSDPSWNLVYDEDTAMDEPLSVGPSADAMVTVEDARPSTLHQRVEELWTREAFPMPLVPQTEEQQHSHSVTVSLDQDEEMIDAYSYVYQDIEMDTNDLYPKPVAASTIQEQYLAQQCRYEEEVLAERQRVRQLEEAYERQMLAFQREVEQKAEALKRDAALHEQELKRNAELHELEMKRVTELQAFNYAQALQLEYEQHLHSHRAELERAWLAQEQENQQRRWHQEQALTFAYQHEVLRVEEEARLVREKYEAEQQLILTQEQELKFRLRQEEQDREREQLQQAAQIQVLQDVIRANKEAQEERSRRIQETAVQTELETAPTPMAIQVEPATSLFCEQYSPRDWAQANRHASREAKARSRPLGPERPSTADPYMRDRKGRDVRLRIRNRKLGAKIGFGLPIRVSHAGQSCRALLVAAVVYAEREQQMQVQALQDVPMLPSSLTPEVCTRRRVRWSDPIVTREMVFDTAHPPTSIRNQEYTCVSATTAFSTYLGSGVQL